MKDDLSVLVTVDTEGDDEWSFHRHPTNENIGHLEEFERALERLGARATYLVTHGVATDERASAILADLHDRGRCEIGAHCHAWNTPPIAEPDGAQLFLNELDGPTQRAKLEALTEAIESAFDVKPTSFRGGRFGCDGSTIDALVDLGYRVESSVTPGVTWRNTEGLPGGPGGPDYLSAPLPSYPIDSSDMNRTGRGPLLEIPLTVVRSRRLSPGLEKWLAGFGPTGLVSKVANRLGLGSLLWFRPTFHSVDEMVTAAAAAIDRGADALNMMLHSSELMPGGSPYIKTKDDASALVGRMEKALEIVMEKTGATPRTLEECRRTISRTARAGEPAAQEEGRIAC